MWVPDPISSARNRSGLYVGSGTHIYNTTWARNHWGKSYMWVPDPIPSAGNCSGLCGGGGRAQGERASGGRRGGVVGSGGMRRQGEAEELSSGERGLLDGLDEPAKI